MNSKIDINYLEMNQPITKGEEIIPAVEYHVVVPIFNEANLLQEMLVKIELADYLDKITFVNDASTDNSKDILDEWSNQKGIEVIHLAENRKKEGAIREALEVLQRDGRLPDKVLLLDADSFMSSTQTSEAIDVSISQALAYMDEHDITAMGFRYDIFLGEKPSLLQKAQYAEFAGLRFMNGMSPEQFQMWVINGRGGVFRSSVLLSILQKIEPDFETGDILITQKIMEAGYKIAYYDDIKIETMDVNTFKDFSIQRRRWARGTAKVMIQERAYYAKEILKLSKIGLMSLLYLLIDIGFPLSLIGILLLSDNPTDFLLLKLPIAMAVWMMIGISLAVSDKGVRAEGFTGKVVRWSLINAALYVSITMPSRLIGLFEAVKYQLLSKIKTKRIPIANLDN